MTEFGISFLIATAKALLGIALVQVSLRLTGRWLMRLTRRTPGDTDDQLLRSVLTTAAPIGYLSAFWWGWRSLVADVEVLNFGEGIDRMLEAAMLFLTIVLIVRLLNRVLLLLLDRSLRRLRRENQLTVLRGLEPMIRSGVWILGLLVFLQNQGVQMGAIYASLAGAGIGLGLALKGPISNFLNYLTILFDEPFRIGQFICFDDVLGTVEGVGIRSTTIRSLSGERIVISNEDLLGKVIQNYGDLPKRRVATTIGVVYQTSRRFPLWWRRRFAPTPRRNSIAVISRASPTAPWNSNSSISFPMPTWSCFWMCSRRSTTPSWKPSRSSGSSSPIPARLSSWNPPR